MNTDPGSALARPAKERTACRVALALVGGALLFHKGDEALVDFFGFFVSAFWQTGEGQALVPTFFLVVLAFSLVAASQWALPAPSRPAAISRGILLLAAGAAFAFSALRSLDAMGGLARSSGVSFKEFSGFLEAARIGTRAGSVALTLAAISGAVFPQPLQSSVLPLKGSALLRRVDDATWLIAVVLLLTLCLYPVRFDAASQIPAVASPASLAKDITYFLYGQVTWAILIATLGVRAAIRSAR